MAAKTVMVVIRRVVRTIEVPGRPGLGPTQGLAAAGRGSKAPAPKAGKPAQDFGLVPGRAAWAGPFR